MKLPQMVENKEYRIVSFGNLDHKKIDELNQIGFIEGEIIKKQGNISCNSKVCLFDLENTTYSINFKYVREVEIEEL